MKSGLKNKIIKKVESLINNAIDDKVFPGCVFLISHHGEIIIHKGFGHFEYNEDTKRVTKKTIYDLASLTKVLATVQAIMILKDRGEIDIDKKVSYYLSKFKGKHKSLVKIRNLLSHSSGLPSWKPLFGVSYDKESLLDNIYKISLEYIPNERCDYSDLGFILLGEIIEKITTLRLDKFCKKYIFEPLNMNYTYFCPPKEIWKDIPPTEYCKWRRKVIQGEVHDENAYIMNGVSGHAGLFSNAYDIEKFCKMILNLGSYNKIQLIHPKTILEFTEKRKNIKDCKWALGWRVYMGKDDIIGSFFSNSSFGHLGFTGTSIWIDPEKEFFTILLSNRIYPSRENKKILEFRPIIHNEILKYIS